MWDEWMVYCDVHMGIAPWRERWYTSGLNRKEGRHFFRWRWRCRCGHTLRQKGVWDAQLRRETFVLSDGRRLSYFLDGGNGVSGHSSRRHELPHIFCFHAMFLSGNSFLMADPPTDYVLVCVNRPGYFGSDPPLLDHHCYTYDTFVSDIEQLADHLGLSSFAVAGHSSGGPCSLACAASPRFSKRVVAVGLLCSDPEYAHESIPNKRAFNVCCLGYCLPFMFRQVLCWLPVARQSVRGMENDYRLETTRYPFHTESIRQPTLVFLGEDDKVMPLHVSRHVHERLSNVQVRTIPKVGHLGLLRDAVLRDFFETLISMASEHDLEQSPQVESIV
jgi:pimeloyl-ACP methyl ester carboxylesterase